MRRYGIVFGLAALALAALLLAACSSNGGGGETPTVVETEELDGEATPPPAAEEESVQVDESYWHAGFKVTLGEARLTAGGVGMLGMEIDVVFENLSDADATPDSNLVLQSGGQNYTESTLDQEIPQVPGGLSSNGLITFQVDEAFRFDDAVLVVGLPSNNQAMVPLTPGAGEVVSLEPQEIAASGSATAGALTVTLTGVEVRADLPEKHDEEEEGKLALTVFFSAMPVAGIQIGQGVLQNGNVALKLPDGTSVAVRSDGISGVNELLQGKEGTTISDLSVRFDVPSPAAGEYALIIKGKYGPGGAQVEAEATFTVP